MWTYDEALQAARRYVAGCTDDAGEVTPEHTLDRPYGWVFFYQSREYLRTGDYADAFAGNSPIIVNRVTGECTETGTAYPIEQYLHEYEASLPPDQLGLDVDARIR
jgi:hypothetical protein